MTTDRPQFEQLTAGGYCWQMASGCQGLFLGSHGLRLEDWLKAGRASVVKQGPHRTTYRVELPGLTVFLKHFRLINLQAWLRDLIRSSKARIEYRKALAVANRGVPTIVPLALGESCGLGPGESYLITRALEGAEPLNLFIEKTLPALGLLRQARVRRNLATELGRFLARMHDAGIIHEDLHPGNLLVRLDGDRPCLALIDLHAVRLRRPLGWRASRANLIVLNRWFMLRASRTDRLRCWQSYSRARKLPGWWEASALSCLAQRFPLQLTAGLARKLERYTWLSNLHFWEGRDRRFFLDSRHHRRLRIGRMTGFGVNNLDRHALEALMADPDAPFRQPDALFLKQSHNSTVVELQLPIDGKLLPVIYKRFGVVRWSDPWVAAVRYSPALRSWQFGHGLRIRCLPTPRPLAVFHRHRLGLAYEGYLLTEKVPHTVNLLQFARRLQGLPETDRRIVLRRLIERLAAILRDLHHRQLSHRDLKSTNLLVRTEALDPQAPADLELVWLIDLVAITRYRKLPRRRKVQNLARLHASFYQSPLLTRTDKLRFLQIYLQWGLLGRSGWKRWWRQIEEATWLKVARNASVGRPLV